MNWVAGNGLTLKELEQLEQAAHKSQTVEAKSMLRLAAALRETLQLKECALYTHSKYNAQSGREVRDAIEIDYEPGRTTQFH